MKPPAYTSHQPTAPADRRGPAARMGEKALDVELGKVKLALGQALGAFYLADITRDECVARCIEAFEAFAVAVATEERVTGADGP